jgi:hypothetical protein
MIDMFIGYDRPYTEHGVNTIFLAAPPNATDQTTKLTDAINCNLEYKITYITNAHSDSFFYDQALTSEFTSRYVYFGFLRIFHTPQAVIKLVSALKTIAKDHNTNLEFSDTFKAKHDVQDTFNHSVQYVLNTGRTITP